MPDDFLVAVDNSYALTSLYQGVIFEDPGAQTKLADLTQYAKQTLLNAGYSVDPENSSVSGELNPFYAVRATFISKDKEYLCVLEPSDTGSPIWSIECIRKIDMTEAHTLDLPFLHAIGDVKGVAAIPTQVGNYARVGITSAGAGGYVAIMKKVNNEWHIVYWNGMRTDMVTALDPFGVYETINGVAHWRMARFEAFVAHHRLYWPRLASGKLCTDDETFRET